MPTLADSNSLPGLGLRTVLEGKFHLASADCGSPFGFPAIATPGMGGAVGTSGENLRGDVVESSTFSTSSLKVIRLRLTAGLWFAVACCNVEKESL